MSSGEPVHAKAGRLAKSKVFVFNQERNGKYYEQKKIEVYYLIENERMITITVYVFFGNFDTPKTILISQIVT